VPDASEEAIEIMDMMLQMNPKDRPDIKTILKHPYFANAIESSPDVLNPFSSPLGTPERNEVPLTHNVFSDGAFGTSDPVPSFGSTINQDSPDQQMETSPVSTGFKIMQEETKSHSKNLLNSGDGMPPTTKTRVKYGSYSTDKAAYLKKARSHVVEDKSEQNLGGFNLSGFGETSKQKKRKNSNHMQIDDEITNISNTQD